VLGGQAICELDVNGSWARGYVYLGGQMLAIQSSGVYWVHQDPITKSQRVTNSSGTVTSTIDLDPWGGETATSSNQAFQPHRFTSYERDANSGDEAMMRRYSGKWHRFHQPDPYHGSYDLSDPQSFNRYSYTQSDPVNFFDPNGLDDEPSDGDIDVLIFFIWAQRLSGGPGSSGNTITYNPWADAPRKPWRPERSAFGGNPLIRVRRSTGTNQGKAPCVHSNGGGAGEVSGSWNPLVVGYTGGVQTTADRVYPFSGMVIGTPGRGGSIMGQKNANISPGLNYSISGGSVIGVSWSGKLDPTSPRTIWQSLKNGSMMYGGTTPGASAAVTYVSEGYAIPCL
jgi:RHS repeat-associated protein